MRPSYVHAGIDLQFAPPPEPMFLCGDPEALRQLVTNLVLNAADAAVAGQSAPPRVRVEIGRGAADGGSIRVRDTGPGPDPAVRDQLFDSFVTTKPDGFGLGLFVARQIAQRHGGQLRWQRDGDMTCFCFDFPLEFGGLRRPHANLLHELDHGTRTDCRRRAEHLLGPEQTGRGPGPYGGGRPVGGTGV